MKTIHYSIMIMTVVILSLSFFHAPTASAHLIPSFSVQPDQNYTDPVTHYLNTKEGHPHIVITRDSEFTLPMTLKSENDSRTTSYLIHVTNGNNFTAETMPSGVSIRVVPDHFITSNGTDQKFNIVIKVDKNAPSGVYEPNLVIKWNDNVTQSREISSISFQVGKWNWDSLSKQMDTGISAENVICKSSDHIVVIKSEDGSPACVKPDTAQILVERGWTKMILVKTGITINSYTPISNETENQTIKIVEIKMVPPYTPGGPVIQLTIQNVGTTPITNLNAILETNHNYTFNFKSITSSTPLISDNSVSDTTMLVGGGFQTESTYSLIISGMKDNMPFEYLEKVQIQG